MAYKDIEKNRECSRSWNEKNKQRCRANRKLYYANHKELFRAYYKSHKEEIDTYQKEWRNNHKEEISLYHKQFHKTHLQFPRLPSGPKHKLSNIDEINKRADCAICGYVAIKKVNYGPNWRCKVSSLNKSKTGIGFGYRSGICEICRKQSDKLVKDHNHDTGQLRGWICQRCNRIVGMVERNREGNIYFDYLKYYQERMDNQNV